MFIKNSEAINNRNTIDKDQTTLECGANNINHYNVNLNLTNFNLNHSYRRLYIKFVRTVISDYRLDYAAAVTAFPTIILLANYLSLSLTVRLKSARGFQLPITYHYH